MAAYIHIKNGQDAGQVVQILPKLLPSFKYPVFIIGTDRRCDLILQDPDAEPVHAMVALNPQGEYVIKRYKPHIMLRVDGEPEASAVLTHGTLLKIGKTVLSFSEQVAIPKPKPVEPPVKPARKPKQRGMSVLAFALILALVASIPVMITAQHLKNDLDNMSEWVYIQQENDQTFSEWVESYEDTSSQARMIANPGRVALLSFDRDT